MPSSAQLKLATGISMRVCSAGEGPVALLLHGFPGLAHCWRRQLPALSDAYRVVAPDLRGYGGTDAPRSWRDYSLEGHLIPDVLSLIDQLGAERVHLVGHDLGGLMAWHFAQCHPERLHTLTAINCPHPGVFRRVLREDKRQRARSAYMLLAQLPWYPERKIARNAEAYITRNMRERAGDPSQFTASDLAPYIEQARSGLRGGLNYYRALLRRRPRINRRIDVPTLLVWGAQDHVLAPELAEPARYEAFVDQLDVLVVEQAAHWVQVEASVQVNARLRQHWRQAHGQA